MSRQTRPRVGIVRSRRGVAQTELAIVDDFESGALTNYSVSSADFTATNTPAGTSGALSGTYVLEAGGTGDDYIFSTSGLNAYPAEGDKYVYYSAGEDLGQAAMAAGDFGWQDYDNTYSIRISYSSEWCDLVRWSGGSGTTLDSDTFSQPYTAEDWLRIELTWDDGTTFGGQRGDMRIKIYKGVSDTAIMSMFANDTTFTGGGIGFEKNTGGTASNVWFDYCHVV